MPHGYVSGDVIRARPIRDLLSCDLFAIEEKYPGIKGDLSVYAPDGVLSLVLNGNGRSVRVQMFSIDEIIAGSYRSEFTPRAILAFEVYSQSGAAT